MFTNYVIPALIGLGIVFVIFCLSVVIKEYPTGLFHMSSPTASAHDEQMAKYHWELSLYKSLSDVDQKQYLRMTKLEKAAKYLGTKRTALVAH